MKATDIMIGDLLRTDKGEVIEVEAIKGGAVGYSCGYYTNIDELEPIPLKEEFLLSNGFEKREHGYYKGEFFKWSVNVSLFDDGSVIKIVNDLDHRGVNNAHICDNGYVHILQHALRLCGLNELADNFKLE